MRYGLVDSTSGALSRCIENSVREFQMDRSIGMLNF